MTNENSGDVAVMAAAAVGSEAPYAMEEEEEQAGGGSIPPPPPTQTGSPMDGVIMVVREEEDNDIDTLMKVASEDSQGGNGENSETLTPPPTRFSKKAGGKMHRRAWGSSTSIPEDEISPVAPISSPMTPLVNSASSSGGVGMGGVYGCAGEGTAAMDTTHPSHHPTDVPPPRPTAAEYQLTPTIRNTSGRFLPVISPEDQQGRQRMGSGAPASLPEESEPNAATALPTDIGREGRPRSSSWVALPGRRYSQRRHEDEDELANQQLCPPPHAPTLRHEDTTNTSIPEAVTGERRSFFCRMESDLSVESIDEDSACCDPMMRRSMHLRKNSASGLPRRSGSSLTSAKLLPFPPPQKMAVRAQSIGLLDVHSIRATSEAAISVDDDDAFAHAVASQQHHNAEDKSNSSSGDLSFHSLEERGPRHVATAMSSTKRALAARRSNAMYSSTNQMMRSDTPPPHLGHPSAAAAAAAAASTRNNHPVHLLGGPVGAAALRQQYQPKREGSFSKVGVEDAEELAAIFADRRNTQNQAEEHDYDDDAETHDLPPGVVALETSHHDLYQAVPLERDNWSIPSLRLAHHLESSTCCSDSIYTDSMSDRGSLCSLDIIENAEIVRLQDDAHGCSDHEGAAGNQSEDEEIVKLGKNNAIAGGNGRRSPQVLPIHQNQIHPSFRRSPPPQGIVISNANAVNDSNLNQHHNDTSRNRANSRSVRRAARKAAKEQKVIEWLQEVRDNGTDKLAEAASSKFLTGSSGKGMVLPSSSSIMMAPTPLPPSSIVAVSNSMSSRKMNNVEVPTPRPPLPSLRREKSVPIAVYGIGGGTGPMP